jgi:hypothetical protein
MPEDERLAVERHLREFDRLGDDLKVIERDLARSSGCARVPQPRCDEEGCAAGLAPRALLFAARLPMPRGK